MKREEEEFLSTFTYVYGWGGWVGGWVGGWEGSPFLSLPRHATTQHAFDSASTYYSTLCVLSPYVCVCTDVCVCVSCVCAVREREEILLKK